MSVMIGIDLGTSTTEAAIYRDGRPEMILNSEKEAVIPSAVGLDDNGSWVFGERAMAQYLLAPERTAIEVKRKTGSNEKIMLGKAGYTPVELQERLLSYVRSYASEYLGEEVDRAVISVPAYFDHAQRAETIEAGERAGFSVERILNEPTAAAMSYGLEHMEENSHVLVYDLGGGTFDVTVLEMFGGVLEIKASSGDSKLGGKDFDECLMEELYRRFQKKEKTDLRNDRAAAARIKDAAERCKIQLSGQEFAQILLPAICTVKGNPVELNEMISREEFEKLTRELMERTHEPIDTALEDAGLTPEKIDHIILVGGSTRMPMVVRDIEEYLGKAPITAVHSQYAVAMGAAIQAGIISGEIDPMQGLVMTDVSAFSLGVSAGDGMGFFDNMSVIIPRNITIPTRRTETYFTASDQQTRAEINVYQGESRIASHNRFLGRFMISGIPPRSRGKEKIDVTFSYDQNGMLSVTARIVSTGKEAAIDIDMKATAGKKEQNKDLSAWKDAPGAKEFRPVIRSLERLLKSLELEENRQKEAETLLNGLKEAILEERKEDARAIMDRLMDFMKELKG